MLLEEALHTTYPPVHLAFGIQQHVAPRMIKLQNFIGRPIEVYNSIIAGCLQSVPMTRVYLQRGIEKVVSEENATADLNVLASDGHPGSILVPDDRASASSGGRAGSIVSHPISIFPPSVELKV